MIHSLILLVVAAAPPAEPEPLKVTGVTVLTVVELPVTVHAPPADIVYWRFKGGVEASTPNGHKGPSTLIITKLPKGDTVIQADCWVIDWEAKAKTLSTRMVVLRRGTGEKKDDDDDPPKPGGGSYKDLVEKPEGAAKGEVAAIAASFREVAKEKFSKKADYSKALQDSLTKRIGVNGRSIWSDVLGKVAAKINEATVDKIPGELELAAQAIEGLE